MEWTSILSTLWPVGILLVGLVGAAIELRVRKLIAAQRKSITALVEKETKELGEIRERELKRIREDFQTAIGNVGNDALDACKATENHEGRLREVETKVNLFWGLLESRMASILRQTIDKDS